MELKVKKLYEDAKLPTYSTDGSACFDLYAYLKDYDKGDYSEMINQHEAISIPTGLAFDIPSGNVMMVYSRSGMGFKLGLRLANSVGVIDSDYKGEVVVKLHKDTESWALVNDGDRIAQAMLVPVDRVSFVEVNELAETDRGTGGFGSTGK